MSSAIPETVVRKIRSKLNRPATDLVAISEVGRAINKAIGARAKYRNNSHLKMVAILKGQINERSLYRAKKLAIWPDHDIRAARDQGMSLRAVDELLIADTIARTADQTKILRQVQAFRIKMINSYPTNGTSAAMRKWKNKVLSERLKITGDGTEQDVRKIHDASRYIEHRISTATERLEALAPRLSPAHRREINSYVKSMRQTQGKIASTLNKAAGKQPKP